MIRVTHSNGMGFFTTSENIRYVTLWNTPMSTLGGMRFYEGDADLVVDFQLGIVWDEVEMISYPHVNKKQALEFAVANEKKIRSILEEMAKLGRNIVTIDLADGKVKVIELSHMNRYSAQAEPKTELFTFDNPDPVKGFPIFYIYEKAQRTSETYGKVFPILAKASRAIFPPVEKPTDEGARFTYMLFNSFMNVKFMPDVPNLIGVKFPTKATCEVPNFLNTKDFEAFLIKSGIDNLKVTQGGVVEEKSDSDDDFDDIPAFILTDEAFLDEEEILDWVSKQIEEKGSLNLQDALTVGFDVLPKLIKDDNKIININIDLAGFVRKMCFYKGVFHVIPAPDFDDELDVALDIEQSLLKVCTEENYPKYQTPLLPAPDTF